MHFQASERQQLINQLKDANKRVTKGRDLLLDGAIQADDYRIIKRECEDKICRLEAKLTASIDNVDMESLWNLSFTKLKLPRFFIQ